jgi:metal-sulfur cluster biosynthetic enzyme
MSGSNVRASLAGRAAEVFACLARVTDPELDEPVTELGFVTGVEVDEAGAVAIGFRLPTYWCAANFAFMMADDMRRETAALPWVSEVRVTLGEHMYADTINRGIAEGRSFQESFGDAAAGGLDNLRQTFLVKAFQRRQEALLRCLLAEHLDPLALTLDALQALSLGNDAARLRTRYLERRALAGATSRSAPAFVTATGERIDPTMLTEYLASLHRVGVNAEFQGALCRGLLAARFAESPAAAGREPTLLDFVHAQRMSAQPNIH